MSSLNHAAHLKDKEDFTTSHQILPHDIYSFYLSLFQFQDETVTQYESILHNVTIITDTTHFPVIAPENLQFNDQLLSLIKKSFKEIAAIIQTYHPHYSFNVFLEHGEKNENLYKDLIIQLLNKDAKLEDIAHNNSIDTDELIFLIINVYKPLFVALRHAGIPEDTTFADHHESYCPFCGFLPDMATIVESKNNKRFLHCALCECQWEFKRVLCVNCGNENTDTLGYYSYEPDEKYRFDYCNKCKTYIKTIRITKQNDESCFDLTVENLITSFLDASALKMGYSRQ